MILALKFFYTSNYSLVLLWVLIFKDTLASFVENITLSGFDVYLLVLPVYYILSIFIENSGAEVGFFLLFRNYIFTEAAFKISSS